MKQSISDFGYNVISIETTNYCNMSCEFCPRPLRNVKLQSLDKIKVFSFLDEISSYTGIDYVNFHGYDEPLLSRDIWSYLDYCKQIGLKTHITTNGFLLNNKNIENILEYAPDRLVISAMVIEEDDHDKIRGTKDNFKRYIDGVTSTIAAIYDCNTRIVLRTDVAIKLDKFTGIKGKARYLADKLGITEIGDPSLKSKTPKTLQGPLQDLLKIVERKSKFFRFDLNELDKRLANYYFHGHFDGGPARKRDRNPSRKTAYVLKENNTIEFKEVFNGRRLSSYYPVEKGTCNTNQLCVLADGTVTLCCMDYEGFTNIGNIFKSDLISILKKNKQIIDDMKYNNKFHFDECKKCQGSPTKLGALLKNTRNKLRYR